MSKRRTGPKARARAKPGAAKPKPISRRPESRCNPGPSPLDPPLPMGFGAPEPEAAGDIPGTEKAGRVVNDGETCVVDDERYFVKGSIEIPVVGIGEAFVWTVWAEISATDFEDALDRWHDADRDRTTPYEGRLATRLPPYAPATLGLPVRVHTRPPGKRPRIEISAADHPLAQEARVGITRARVAEIAARVLRG